MRQIMYTEPKIVTINDLNYRSYIEFCYNGKRFREYNGNRINVKVFPNRSKSLKEKNRLLSNLLFEFTQKLKAHWNPLVTVEQLEIPTTKPKTLTVEEVFREIELEKQNSSLSKRYKKDIRVLSEQFISFLKIEEKFSKSSANSLEFFKTS